MNRQTISLAYPAWRRARMRQAAVVRLDGGRGETDSFQTAYQPLIRCLVRRLIAKG